MTSTKLHWLLFFAATCILLACRKDDPSEPIPPVEVDGRDRFVGDYLVFDTLGALLYEMNISKFGSGGRDSLLIENYADTFDLRVLHERYWDQEFLQIGAFFPAIDHGGYRWSLWGATGEDGSNTLAQDTIPLKFNMSNLAFYWDDGVPFFSCVCEQIAVKQ